MDFETEVSFTSGLLMVNVVVRELHGRRGGGVGVHECLREISWRLVAHSIWCTIDAMSYMHVEHNSCRVHVSDGIEIASTGIQFNIFYVARD